MVWNKAQRRLKRLPTDVYQVFDANGVMLYVGAAVNVFTRLNEHRKYAAWWHIADHAIVQRFPDRVMARYIEAITIRDVKPRYNVTRELSEERRHLEVAQPIEVIHLFWEDGKVWVNAQD